MRIGINLNHLNPLRWVGRRPRIVIGAPPIVIGVPPPAPAPIIVVDPKAGLKAMLQQKQLRRVALDEEIAKLIVEIG